MELLQLKDIERARKRIEPHVLRTPSLGFDAFPSLLFKLELFQETGSFKVRGIFNRLLSMGPAERARGIVSMSAGNAAAAFAYAGSQMSIPVSVVMPEGASQKKVEATKNYGATVVLTDSPLMQVVHELEEQRGLQFIHPFDDLEIMAGHGTIGFEILEDCGSVKAVVVPVGGGGLIGGVATAIKRTNPSIKVIGVEPEEAPGMTRALAEGKPVALDHPKSVADGLAAPFAGEHTLAHAQQFVDEMVLVTEEEIKEGVRSLVGATKVVAEGAGAAAIAAIIAGKVDTPNQTVVVVSGGNIDARVLSEWL